MNILKQEVQKYLVSGGDHRLSIDSNYRNSYGIRCYPESEGFRGFSSTTASTISQDAFEHVCNVYRNLKRDGYCYKIEIHKVRNKLRMFYGLDDAIDIAFGPSGTDLELLAVFSSIVASDAKSVTNVVSLPDQIGSGSVLAAKGLHFSSLTSTGSKCVKGSMIPGFESYSVNSLEVDIFAGKTTSIEDEYKYIENMLQESLLVNDTVLLHLVYGSKIGLIYPRLDNVHKLCEKFGNQLHVVVDCCQGRVSKQTVRSFLDNGWIVLLTGSKFFGGPPFSGVMFFPLKYRDNFLREDLIVPKGLSMFFGRYEFPDRWKCFDQVLDEKQINLGLLLRWEAAIYEMESFFAADNERIIHTIKMFNDTFDDISEKSQCFLRANIYPDFRIACDNLDTNLLNTLINFKVFKNREALTYEELLRLNNVIKEKIGRYEGYSVGQPVKLNRLPDGRHAGVLRMALGARELISYAGVLDIHKVQAIRSDLESVLISIEEYVTNI